MTVPPRKLPPRLMGRVQPLRRGRFFYGWWIVGLVFCTQFVALGFTVHGLNLMLWPMAQDLGWGRTTLASVISLSPFVASATAFAIGGILDRYGGKWLMITGLLLLAAGLFGLSFLQEPWQYYLLWIFPVTIGSNLAGTLVGTVTISNWFVRKRGRAMANATMGQSLAAMLMPWVVTLALALGSWRLGWQVMSLGPLLLILPAALIMRRRPEDYGLLPDGEPAPDGSVATPRPVADRTWTRGQLLRNRNFWLVVTAYAVSGFGTISLAVHMVAFLADSGLGAEGALGVASAMSAATLVSRPIWGFFIERLGPRAVSMGAFGLHILLLLLLLNLSLPLVLLLAIVVRGFCQGSIIPIQETIWADFFGRPSLGVVRGVAMPFTMVVSAGGPAFAGFVYDQTHSYTPAFLLFIVGFAMAIGLMALTRPPRRA